MMAVIPDRVLVCKCGLEMKVVRTSINRDSDGLAWQAVLECSCGERRIYRDPMMCAGVH